MMQAFLIRAEPDHAELVFSEGEHQIRVVARKGSVTMHVNSEASEQDPAPHLLAMAEALRDASERLFSIHARMDAA